MSANSLSESRMLKLMAYADGELEGAERAEVERWLATDMNSVRFANEIAGLGDLVKTGHEDSADAKAVASFDIADAVMAAVKADKPAAKAESTKASKPAAVVSLDAARARSNKNLKVGGMVAAALALAASVFVMTRNKEEEAPIARAPVQAVQPSPNASAEPGVDVDLVETAGDSVRVFYLSNESSPTTSVTASAAPTAPKAASGAKVKGISITCVTTPQAAAVPAAVATMAVARPSPAYSRP